jgi:hypothetical protein
LHPDYYNANTQFICFMAYQATLAKGWFGKGEVADNYYLHQKIMFFRLSKTQPRLNLYAGIAHYAQWGGYAPVLVRLNGTDPTRALPKSLNDFGYVFIAKNQPQTPNISSYDSENRIGMTVEPNGLMPKVL